MHAIVDRLPSRIQAVLSIVMVLLLWGGCSGDAPDAPRDERPEPIADPTLAAVARSPWGRLIDAHGHLELTERGWRLDPKRTPRDGFMTSWLPGTADAAAIIVGTDERELRITPVGREGAVGEPHGNAAVYRDTRSEQDVVAILTGNGMEELIVWHAPRAVAPLSYELQLPAGGSVSAKRGGGYVVFDDLGRHFARLLPAAAVDAAGRRLAAEIELEPGGETALLTLTVDTRGAVFPVTVDPAWTHGPGFPLDSVTAMDDVTCDSCNAIYSNVTVIAEGGAFTVSGSTTVYGYVAADVVTMDYEATVTKDVATNGFEGEEKNVWGDILALDVPVEHTVPAVPIFTHGSGTTTYSSNTTGVSPAIHGHMVVEENVSVSLTPGVHTYRSITIEDYGSLECEDACELRVSEDVTLGRQAFLGHATDSSKAWLFALAAGPTPAYDTGLEATTHARVFAPNGTIHFGAEGQHTGRFVGVDVYIGSDEVINGEMIPGEPDCAFYCDRAVALACPQSPATTAACVAACEASLTDPYCAFQHRWFVDCFNEGTTSLYCDDGEPMREGCQAVWAEADICDANCANTDDGNDCTDDYCDCPIRGCNGPYHVSTPKLTPCNDGDLCTAPDTCDGDGTCVGPPKAEDGNECTVDSCDPATGNVSNRPKSDGSYCDDDNDVCDGIRTCSAGTCVAGTPLNPNDGDICTIDSCDPILGVINRPDETYVSNDPCVTDVCGGATYGGCSEVDRTLVTRLHDAVSWIYEGKGTNPPIQSGVSAGTINPDRVAVIRGMVVDQLGDPIANATVEAVDDTLGYGSTITKQDGWFDYVVNGGGHVAIRVTFEDKLEVQRRVKVRWGDYTVLKGPDRIVLIEPDVAFTVVELGSAAVQAHVATTQTDAGGPRTAKLVFPANLSASFVDENGTPTAVTTDLTVRATEYTVGPDGPQRMPADLPPQSAYTYCAELGVDELPANAVSVEFGKPVPFYLDNFVNIPVGMDVPMGYYDRQLSRWIASDNGRCIELVGIDGTSGKALVNIDDQPGAETETQIATELGVDPSDLSDELVKLAELYPQAATTPVEVWRIPVTHFTPFDPNFPGGASDDDEPPFGEPEDPGSGSGSSSSSSSSSSGSGGSGVGGAGGGSAASGSTSGSGSSGPVSAGAGAGPPVGSLDQPLPGPSPDGGCADAGNSSVECLGQVLHEWIDLPGTPFRLHYASDRVPGRKSAYALRMPLTLSAPTIPSTLKGIELTISVAGERWDWHFDCPAECGPETIHPFEWDGLDAYKRAVQGSQPVHINLGYTYDAVYMEPAAGGRSFMRFGTTKITMAEPQVSFTIWRPFYTSIGTFDAKGVGLGGWDLDVHHVLDPISDTVYFGDGSRMRTDDAGWTVTKMTEGVGTDPLGFDVGVDGSVYYAMGYYPNDTLYRRETDGTVTTMASWNQGTGRVTDLATPQDGVVFVVFDGQVIQVGPGATTTPVFGQGTVACITADGSALASDAKFSNGAGDGISSIAVGPDGDVYLAETEGGSCKRIVRVDGKGYLHLAVGGVSTSLATTSEAPALDILLGKVTSMAIDDDGTMYLYDSTKGHIVRVGVDGIAHRHAGGGTGGSVHGNGGLAVNATLGTVYGMAVDHRGLFLAVPDAGEPDNMEGIRLVTPNGTIERIAGYDEPLLNCSSTYCGLEGAPALHVQLDPRKLGIMPNGDVAVLDLMSPGNILRMGRPRLATSDFLVPSPDGRLVYHFDLTGQHQDTRDAVTGTVLYDFDYDATTNRLIKVTDATGQEYDIEYDATTGEFDKIAAPYSRDFPVTLNADGYLATLSYPTTPVETYTIGYSTLSGATGLLTSFQKPEGTSSSYEYEHNATDPWFEGLVKKVTDPLGKEKTFTRTMDDSGVVEVELMTPEGLKKTYWYGPGGGFGTSRGNFHNTFPGAAVAAQSQTAADGTVTITQPNGTTLVKTEVPDPRFGLMAPVVSETITTPGNKQMTIERERSVTFATDPLNPSSWEEKVTVNGRLYVTSYDETTTGVWVTTTPEDRKRRRTVAPATGLLTETTLLDTTGAAIEHATAYTYDASNRLQTTVVGTGAEARTTTWGYHTSGGWLETVQDALSQTTTYERDGAWRVTKETRPDAKFTQQAWDKNGNLVGLTPPGKPQHAFTYTDLDQRDTYEPPDLDAAPNQFLSDWGYDDDRRVSTIAHPDFDVLSYTYGPTTGWLEKISTPTADLRVFDYFTTSGQLEEIETLFGAGKLELTFGYDGHLPTTFDWLASATAGGAEDFAGGVELVYDDNFWVFQEKVDDGTTTHTIEFRYDLDGLPTVAAPPASIVSNACSGSATDCLSVTWDPDTGRLDSTAIGVVTDEYTYTDFGEIESYVAKVSGVTKFSYTINLRDALGRIARKTETVDGVTTVYEYDYDLAGRLEEVRSGPDAMSLSVTDTYGYDDNGNRTSHNSATGTYDNQDRIQTYDGWTYSSNDRGDVVSKVDGSTSDTWLYGYDAFGALVSVTDPTSDVVTYRTDGKSRRVMRLLNGTVTNTWLWRDQLRLAAELTPSGALKARYVSALERNVPEVIFDDLDGTTVTKRLITDHLGSVRMVIDTATGTILQTHAYSAFGIMSGSAPGQPFGFAGGLYDVETGLVRFGAREYQAALGRWTSRDSLYFDANQANLYAYAGSDPVNNLDPDGEKQTWYCFDCTPGQQKIAEKCVEEVCKDNWKQNGHASFAACRSYCFADKANCQPKYCGDKAEPEPKPQPNPQPKPSPHPDDGYAWCE